MPSPPSPRTARRWIMPVLKVVVVAVVLAAVGGSLVDALRAFAESPLRPHVGVALLSALAYAIAYLPMGLFWQKVLRVWRQPAATAPVLSAYYVGHLGKYVPGKAMVIILRTGALRALGGKTTPIAVSVFVETLTFMAVGGVLAGGLLMSPRLAADQPAWLVLVAFGLAAGSILPVCPPVMNRLVQLYESKRGGGADAEPHPPIDWRLLGWGALAALAAWAGMAMSVWLAVRAFHPGFDLSLPNYLQSLLAATLPVVAGFLSLIPGGLLVRDGLMVALLTPAAGPEAALAATVLVRVGWIGSEALVCGILVATGVGRSAS